MFAADSGTVCLTATAIASDAPLVPLTRPRKGKMQPWIQRFRLSQQEFVYFSRFKFLDLWELLTQAKQLNPGRISPFSAAGLEATLTLVYAALIAMYQKAGRLSM